jgi:hypothetical protein
MHNASAGLILLIIAGVSRLQSFWLSRSSSFLASFLASFDKVRLTFAPTQG